MLKVIFISLIFISSAFSYEKINESNFDEKISKGKVVVEFHATWCEICKETNKNLVTYLKNKPEGVTFYNVDIGEEIYLTKKYDALSIPLFVYFKDGKVIGREDGLRSPAQIKDAINKYYQ